MRTRDLLRLKKDTEYLLMGSCDYVYKLSVHSVKAEDVGNWLWHGGIAPIEDVRKRTGLFISYEKEDTGYYGGYRDIEYPVLRGVAGDSFISVHGNISLYDFDLIGEYKGKVDREYLKTFRLHKKISNKRSK